MKSSGRITLFFAVLGMMLGCDVYPVIAQQSTPQKLVEETMYIYKDALEKNIEYSQRRDLSTVDFYRGKFKDLFVEKAGVYMDLDYVAINANPKLNHAPEYYSRLSVLASRDFERKRVELVISPDYSSLSFDGNKATMRVTQAFSVDREEKYRAVLLFTFSIVEDQYEVAKIAGITHVSHELFRNKPPKTNEVPKSDKKDSSVVRRAWKPDFDYPVRFGLSCGWNQSFKMGTFGLNFANNWFRSNIDLALPLRDNGRNQYLADGYTELFPAATDGEVSVLHYEASNKKWGGIATFGVVSPKLFSIKRDTYLVPSANMGLGCLFYDFYRDMDNDTHFTSAFVLRLSFGLELIDDYFCYMMDVGYGWSKYSVATGAYFNIGVGLAFD